MAAGLQLMAEVKSGMTYHHLSALACSGKILLVRFTYRSNAVVQLWFSVACFGVRVSVTFKLKFVYINTYIVLFLVRFKLLSDHLLGKSCSLG